MRAPHFDGVRTAWAVLGLAVLFAGCPSVSPVGPDIPCTRDADCAEGQSCAQGLCRACPACADGETCIAATCVPIACGDAICPIGQGCWDGHCVTSECFQVSCAEGQACAAAACHAEDCPTQECRAGEVCVDGKCATASCFDVTCPAGQVCANGSCLPESCNGVACAAGRSCLDGQCVETVCVGVLCPQGATCVGGLCRPTACAGVACADGEACIGGLCQDARCFGAQCPPGTSCEAGGCVGCPGGECCTAPEPCGVNDSCARPCEMGGLGACQPPSGPVDFQTDVSHCGACGNACPPPAHATPECVAGVCARGPCDPGYFDLDGPVTPGCEASCTGNTCTLPDGGTLTIDSVLLPESGLLPHGVAAGATVGAQVQTSTQHTNQSVLGEGTPLSTAGATEQTGASWRNHGGFVPSLRP